MFPSIIKVLLVEDEQLVAEDISEILQEEGYAVTGMASEGKAAIEMFKETEPDIVLMDINLQGEMDGIQVAEALNQIRRTPIVYLTAQADAASVARARATKPSAYLLKPFEERNLLISLDIALSNFSEKKIAAHPVLESNESEGQITSAKEKLRSESILASNDVLFIKQNYKFVKVMRKELLYIEADGSHAYINILSGRLVLRLSLSQIVERLADEQLVRVHRSFAVMRNAIESFTETEIIIQQRSIPIGEAYKESFLKGFMIL